VGLLTRWASVQWFESANAAEKKWARSSAVDTSLASRYADTQLGPASGESFADMHAMTTTLILHMECFRARSSDGSAWPVWTKLDTRAAQVQVTAAEGAEE
jgi:hypothetical protein